MATTYKGINLDSRLGLLQKEYIDGVLIKTTPIKFIRFDEPDGELRFKIDSDQNESVVVSDNSFPVLEYEIDGGRMKKVEIVEKKAIIVIHDDYTESDLNQVRGLLSHEGLTLDDVELVTLTEASHRGVTRKDIFEPDPIKIEIKAPPRMETLAEVSYLKDSMRRKTWEPKWYDKKKKRR